MPTQTHDAVLDTLRAERDQARDAAIALAESQDFDPTSDAFTALQARSESLDTQVQRLVTLYGARDQADALDGRLSRATTRSEQQQTQTRQLTAGEAFVRSDAFTSYRFSGNSGVLDYDPGELQTRALPTGIADLVAAGWKGAPTRVDTTPPLAPTPLLDAMSTVQVSGNSIEYVAWRKVAGGAAKVAEKAAKPSAEFGPVVTPAALDNIAVYTQLTRQLLEDEPAARSAVDNLMRYDVLRAEEAEATAVLAAAAATIPDATGSDLMAAIRVAIGTVQAAGYSPNAVLLNPADWAALDIIVFDNANTTPNINGHFWGLTPIPSISQAEGTAVVGDFRQGLTHYTRSAVSLYVTDSHQADFISNIFTLLAERRSKTVVVRPAALCEATGTVTP